MLKRSYPIQLQPFRHLLALLCFLCATTSSWAAPKWWTAEAAPFQVISNARKAEIQRSFEYIWHARAGLQVIFPELRQDGDDPLLLAIAGNANTRDSLSFRTGRRRRSLGGYFTHDCAGHYTIINDIGSEELTRQTIVHEYVHHLMRKYSNAPLWIKEGFAELFSTIHQNKNGQLVLGLPIATNVQYLRYEGFMPIKQLVNVHQRSPEYTGGQHTGTFYSQSWLLLHYLLLGEHEIPFSKVTSFVHGALNSRATTESLFDEHLGLGFFELEERLEQHLIKGRSYTLTFELPEQQKAPALELVAASEQETETLFARVALGHSKGDDTRATISAARKKWPNSAELLALEGEWLHRNERSEEALRYFESALASDDKNARANFWYAVIHGGELLEGSFYQPGALNQEETLKLLTHLFRAKQSGAGHYPQLYSWIGTIWLSSDVYPESRHMTILENALAEHPGRYGIIHCLTLYYARSGKYEKAEALIKDSLPLMLESSREDFLADFSDLRSIDPIYK